uniref:Uncharacterized protein n=1 Tax=Romanomermis culicivorax TaxID=13658 RepID=A0A915KD77_ROMCU
MNRIDERWPELTKDSLKSCGYDETRVTFQIYEEKNVGCREILVGDTQESMTKIQQYIVPHFMTTYHCHAACKQKTIWHSPDLPGRPVRDHPVTEPSQGRPSRLNDKSQYYRQNRSHQALTASFFAQKLLTAG